MKKMQTIFIRDYRVTCTPVANTINPECQWVFDRECVMTRKIDGINVRIINGTAMQRIKPETPHYIKADYSPITDEFVMKAILSRPSWPDGYYEAYGEGIRENKERIKGQTMIGILPFDPILIIHDLPINYRSLMGYLSTHDIEGIVFHNTAEPETMAKIKTRDFYHLKRP